MCLTRISRSAASHPCLAPRTFPRERGGASGGARGLRGAAPAAALWIASARKPGAFREARKTRGTKGFTPEVCHEYRRTVLSRFAHAGPPPLRAGRRRTERPGRVPAAPRRVRSPARVPRGRVRLALGVLPHVSPPPRGRGGAAHRSDEGAAAVPEARGGAARRTAVPVDGRAARADPDGGQPGRPRLARRVPDEGGGRAPRRDRPA